MISFWKRTSSNDVLANNRYLMKYAVAHRKHNYCCHSIIYIQECTTLVEGLLFGIFEAEDVTFLLCRCSTLKLGIVSIYLTGSVQYWLSIFLSMRAHMCEDTRQHKLSLLEKESEHVWKRGRGTAEHSSAGDIHWSLRLIGWGRLVCSQVLGEFVDGSVWEVSRSKNTNTKYSVFHLRREAWSLSHFEHLWFLTQRCVALGMNSWAVSQCVLMLKFVPLPCSTSIGVTYYYYFTFQIEVIE